MIRALQPQAVINDRGFGPGDVAIAERDENASVDASRAFERPVEACFPLDRESWGYRESGDFYTDRYLMQSIDKVLAKGGNHLLNVGPTADGIIPPEQTRILTRIGDWYRKIRESLLNAEPAPAMTENHDVLVTRRDNTLYVHLVKVPCCDCVVLNPIRVAPRKAVLLNSGACLDARVEMLPRFHKQQESYLCIHGLPANRMSGSVMVVRLDFAELPAPMTG